MAGTSGNLIFPIGFDFNKGLSDAEGESRIAIQKIQQMMNRSPVTIKMDFDMSNVQRFKNDYSRSINDISESISRLNRAWNNMSISDKFDADGNLTGRARHLLEIFQQLTTAATTYGQTLSEVNRKIQKDLAETEKAIVKAYQQQDKEIQKNIAAKEREAAAQERARQAQLKGVNAGYIDTQKQAEAVERLRLQYEAILPTLNALMQKRFDIRMRIDKQFEADVNRINILIDGLRQKNLTLGTKGDTAAIQNNLAVIKQLEAELEKINNKKLNIFNADAIHGQIKNVTNEIVGIFEQLQNAQRKFASDTSLNSALDAQGQKVMQLHEKIRLLDAELAQMNATGKLRDSSGGFTAEATAKLQERINLTKQLTKEAMSGQQMQVELERQLQAEKRKTAQEEKQAAAEAKRQAQEEKARREANRQALEQERQARRSLFEQKRAQWQREQAILKNEEKTIQQITEKLQLMQQKALTTDYKSDKFKGLLAEVDRLTTKLSLAKQKMDELTGKATDGANKQAQAAKNVNSEFNKQSSYLENLIRRMAVYASIGAIGGFLQKVREVTAEFELQRVSLGAIIQDQNRANALFSEIKNYALKSPVKILDLTRYTKQLAAYQIETDKLFETTKRLTDVAVGLGTDMSRLILAYGETKASHVLNAKELRQFAMMGIPMLELLSEKLSEINHKTITTSETFEMIKKRMVGFDVVAQVFEDLTNKGGIFYNMQEKQGNTLYGMWQKLGDAASVMYDSIGNTDWVNESMKAGINLLRSFMLAWKDVARVIGIAAVAFVAFKANSAILSLMTANTAKLNAATTSLTAAEQRLNATRATSSTLLKQVNALKVLAARYNVAAARSTDLWTIATFKLKAAMATLQASLMSFAPMLVITAIISVWQWIDSMIEKANKLKNALDDIQSSTGIEVDKSVRNFESLVEQALKAKDGSKEQRDALEELNTTYGKILRSQDLQIDKLREMRDNYDSLTQAIRDNIAEQQRQQGITAIMEEFAPKIKESTDALRKMLTKKGIDAIKTTGSVQNGDFDMIEMHLTLETTQFDRILQNVEKKIRKEGKAWKEAWREAFKMEGLDFDTFFNYSFAQQGDFYKAVSNFGETLEKEEKELGKWNDTMRESYPLAGQFAKYIEDANEAVAKMTFSSEKNTFAFDQERTNATINEYLSAIQKALKDSQIKINLSDFIEIDETLSEEGKEKLGAIIDWDALIDEIDKKGGKAKDELKSMLDVLQKEWDKLVPPDPVVRALRGKLIEISATIDGVGISIDKMRQYFWDGETELHKQIKTWKGELATLRATIYAYAQYIKLYGESTKTFLKMAGLDVEEMTRQADALEKFIKEAEKYDDPALDKSKKKKGSKKGKSADDQRLQTLQEVVQLLEKANSERDKLAKKEGPGLAKIHTEQSYGDWFKYVNSIKIVRDGLKAIGRGNFEFVTPENTDHLLFQLDLIKQIYEYYQKQGKKAPKGVQKALLDLGTSMSTFRVENIQKEVEIKLKEISEKISQSKAAKEFYDKILSQTGDIDIAEKVTISIYGGIGDDVKKNMVDQILTLVGDVEKLTSNLPGGTVNNLLDQVVNFETNDIDYKKLEQWVKVMAETLGGVENEVYKELMKIAHEGQKGWAKQILDWEKTYEKVKSIQEKITDVIKKETQERNRILTEVKDPTERERLLQGSYDYQNKKIADLQVEEFKQSEYYINMFEDLANQSASALKNMRDAIQGVIDTQKDMSPENMKVMVEALQKINDELDDRKLFDDWTLGFKGMFKAVSEVRKAQDELAIAKAEADAERPALQEEYENALIEQMLIEGQLSDLQIEKNANQEAIIAKEKELNAAKERTALAEQKLIQNTQKVQKAQDNVNKKQRDANKKLQKFINTSQKISQVISNIKTISEGLEYLFGDLTSEATTWGNMLNATLETLSQFQAIMEIVILLQGIFNAETSANPWFALAAAILAVTVGLAKFISDQKVAAANKEIEKQEKILHDLEYTYDRLQKAQEKLFGSDYIQNYNQQLAVLRATAAAYNKQLEAERSKGKQADKDAMQDYEDSWRDTMDEIKDMRDNLQQYLLGTDITSAARDWANAWLEARWSFEDTTEAMKEKFADMVQNMIVESLAAKIVESALSPVFEAIDNLSANEEFTAEDIAEVAELAMVAMENAGAGMEGLMAKLQEAGVNLQEIFGGDNELTGIARDIASASEESINGLAQGINTQNYYISHVPTISENVMAIRLLMEGGATPQIGMGTDLVTMQNEHLAQLPVIAANTLATAERCERAAVACEEMADYVRRAVHFDGGTAMINTRMLQ